MWELGEALALWLFERGVRVDAASRSLKHDWLESGVTGLQILVTSEAPDAQTLPPGPIVELVAAPQVSPSPTSGRNAPTLIKRRPRSWLPALVGFAVVAAAALLVFTLLWSRAPGPAAAEVRGQAVVSPHVVVSPPPVIEAPSVTAQAVAESPSALPIKAAASAASVATAPTAKARPPTRAPGSSPSSTRVTTPQKAPQRKGLNTEFGF